MSADNFPEFPRSARHPEQPECIKLGHIGQVLHGSGSVNTHVARLRADQCLPPNVLGRA